MNFAENFMKILFLLKQNKFTLEDLGQKKTYPTNQNDLKFVLTDKNVYK